MVQLVFALEKDSVAAAKREISVEKGAEWEGALLVPEVLDGISLGSWVEVMGAGSSPCGGVVEGGVGGAFGSSGDVIGAVSDAPVLADSLTERRFCSPLMFGTRKLYAIDWVAGGGCPRMWSNTCAELAICKRGSEWHHLSYRLAAAVAILRHWK